jgi:hypothetical protein
MINEKYIKQAEEALTDMPDKDFADYLKLINRKQPAMAAYVMAMGDIFEDEDEYFNKYIFYYAIIHKSYTSRFRYFPEIKAETINRIEERDEQELSELVDAEPEELENRILEWIKKHPQKALLSFFYDDLFASEDDDFDDIGEELDSQIFFMLISIVNIYEESLVMNQQQNTKK